MLTRMTPEQISEFWDIIKYGIEQSLPPIAFKHSDVMNRLLTSLIAGKTQCWASYNKSSGIVKFEGIIITRLLLDDVSDTRNLLIYAIYGYHNVDRDSWMNGLKTLVKYARSIRCKQIVAYSSAPNVVSLVKKLGADTDYTFISFALENYDEDNN